MVTELSHNTDFKRASRQIRNWNVTVHLLNFLLTYTFICPDGAGEQPLGRVVFHLRQLVRNTMRELKIVTHIVA